MTNEMAIETSHAASESRIRMTGRLAIASSPRFRAVLLSAICKTTSAVLVVDLSAISYLDTSGVATLLEAARAAFARRVHLRVIGLAGEPRMLAEITELDVIFRAYGSDVELA